MSGRWDKSSSKRGRLYFNMLIIGAIIVWTATIGQVAIYLVYRSPVAISQAIGEGTLAIMLVWAAFFMQKVRNYGSSE